MNDKFLLNRKKIWAIFFLCFSIPRNLCILFYDFDRKKKVLYLRILKVIAFFWVTFEPVYFWAIMTFPSNFQDFPGISTNFFSSIFLIGGVFGFDLLLFYSAFSIMYEKLQSIYLRRIKFNLFTHTLKLFLYYMVCINIIISIMNFIYPFIGSGPIFAYITKTYIVDNCNKYWYTNVIFISDFFPW